MLKSFQVKNFRGFKEFTLPSLAPINLIIGKNNIGKTALLEAIFLFTGSTNPTLTLTLNYNRNVASSKLEAETIWGWLFHYCKMEESITCKATDALNNNHLLTITLETSGVTVEASEKIPNNSFSLQQNKKLTFSYKKNDQSEKITHATINIYKNLIEISPSDLIFPESIFLPSTQPFNARENTERFSELQNKKKNLEIIEIMKIIEPNLKNLVVSNVGGVANIEADIGEKLLIPVNVMGDGMARLLAILLAIAKVSKGGCLMIDEIENGFYYKNMTKIWQVIGNYSKQRDVQIIATTHSYECVRAAHEAYQDLKEYPLSVHRLEKIDNYIQAVTYDKETLETSFELGWEIR